nr:Asp23/Gls24 family envelope stress response protein [uncultured Anaerobutyricum sp.]
MGKEKDIKINHTVYNIEDVGQVQIADEVVAVIAGLAATETDGVAKMSGNITNEIVSKLGMKKLSKGVKVVITGTQVDVTLNLVLNYGVSIPKTSQEVQDKVKSAIETMTGLTVSEVNIRIAGIQMDYE